MAQDLDDPTATIARRLRELRGRRMSGQQLAEAMTAEGVPWDRSVVANLENGRRRQVSVQEWLCLARVLQVGPLDLLLPTKGEYRVTPTTTLDAAEVRAWLRGTTDADQNAAALLRGLEVAMTRISTAVASCEIDVEDDVDRIDVGGGQPIPGMRTPLRRVFRIEW